MSRWRKRRRRVTAGEQPLIAAMVRAQYEPEIHDGANPNGAYPACMNALGTYACERCGADVRESRGRACPAVAPERRWGPNAVAAAGGAR